MTARVPKETPPKKKRRDDLVGRVVGGRYQLILRLASGGMGSVYAGRAVGAGGFERRLAIKLLHEHLAEREKFVAMFLDEARLAAKIHHPNVVSTIDVFEWDDRYYLVMEYVEGLELGRLLHSALQQRDRLPVRVVLRIVLDALSGLVAAHELTDKNGQPLNLVHRDISPQNILVGADGISRLTDFGVAKAEDRIHVTQGAEFKGKVAYAAPEQLEHSMVEQRSDVFAMGIILWETLTQKRLFKAKDKHGIRRMVLAGDYPPPSSIDPTLLPFDSIVEQAMARKLEDRTPSAAALMAQVEELAATVGGPASPNDVRNWVRSLAGEHLAERAEELREAEASVSYPSEVVNVPPSAPGHGASAPPAVPEQSEVVPSMGGAVSLDDEAGPTLKDPRPSRERDALTQNSRPQRSDPADDAPTRLADRSQVGLGAEARADAASFEESATRKYERPDSNRGADGLPPLHMLPTDPSDISVEMLESEPRLESGVERAGGHSRALGHDPFGEDDRKVSTSVIDEVAARHQRLLWGGAIVMLLLAAGIVGTVISMAVSEEDEPPVIRVVEPETETETESETETETETETASETGTASETETETETASETDTETASGTEPETTSETDTPTAPSTESLTEPLTEMRRRPTMRWGAMRAESTPSTTTTTSTPTPPSMDPEPTMAMPDNPYRDL